MHPASLVIQQPSQTQRLVLLMHGVGSVPQSMLGVGAWFAQRDAQALVVSVASPYPSDVSPSGLQWFSVRGVTEDNRPQRVEAAMPLFLQTVRHWQAQVGVEAQDTLIAGFSQGAIMALEAGKPADAPAATVVAIAGRYAAAPTAKPGATVHLLHGDADGVMPVALAHTAFERLQALGAKATLDVAPGVGHQPDARMLALLARHLPA
ncbi:esterase [Herbaspirillum robiniae]|uniref:esterase n=1 Tax=Herbaspirillum robiniae TaxID=2014887 RepID=UPI003D773138